MWDEKSLAHKFGLLRKFWRIMDKARDVGGPPLGVTTKVGGVDIGKRQVRFPTLKVVYEDAPGLCRQL